MVSDHVSGDQYSTVDLAGQGAFSILTGIGGKAWRDAAKTVGTELGMDLRVDVFKPRQAYVDHTGYWARARDIEDTGCILVRSDQQGVWRIAKLAEDPAGELRRVMTKTLSR